MKAYKQKSSAVRAARKELGKSAQEGQEFKTFQTDAGWGYSVIEHVEEEAPTKASVEIKRKSDIGKPCSTVWEIAEEMKDARRKDVIAECVKQGIAFNTARTQYQRWFTAVKESEAVAEEAK